MDRRSVLKTVSILVGGAMSAGTVTAIMTGCQPNDSEGWTPSLFSTKQIKMVAEIAETILPETDTPGAKELLVDRYIDEVLLTCHPKETQQKVLAGLDVINSVSKSVAGKDFIGASAEERKTILESCEKQAGDKVEEYQFFKTLKTLTVAGFFSTEVGQTQVLQHLAIPQKYLACVPLEEAGNGKTWAQ